jgi:hypothetical protein
VGRRTEIAYQGRHEATKGHNTTKSRVQSWGFRQRRIADDIRMDEAADKRRADGKHGMLGASSSDYAVRWGENPDRLTGPAWCGPACQVVWDSWLAE